jgi:hypothetical protein
LCGKTDVGVADPNEAESKDDQEASPGKKPPGSLQGSAGSAVPTSAWTSLHDESLCGLVWTVKWCPQGLMPVRAQIVLLSDVVLPAKKALKV